MKVLLIGGAGYIGSVLTESLLREGDQVTVLDTLTFGNYLFGVKTIHAHYKDIDIDFLGMFDTIVLLAGHSSVKMCLNDPFGSMKNNVFHFVNLAKKIEKVQKKFIYLSSSSVYGNAKGDRVDETYDNISPNNEYDLEKYLIDEYMLGKNIDYYGLRLGTVNGHSPNLRDDLMINAMVSSAYTTGKINICNPTINRPILFTRDLCKAILTIIHWKESRPGLYNLASFNSTVLEIGQAVSRITKAPLQIVDNVDMLFSNEKIQTKNYDFSISSRKFEKTFSFSFTGTTELIVLDLLRNSPLNSGGRNTSFSSEPPKGNEVKTCLICLRVNYPLLDFGSQPLANDYHKKEYPLSHYPLCLNFCENCHHLQLSFFVDRSVLFQNYQYESGTSKTLKDYFKWLALKIKSENEGASSILEIACNDGSQLDFFKEFGWETVGIDPAENIVSKITNHKVYPRFFNLENVHSIFEGKTYPVVLAQNVIAHTDEPHSFLQACTMVMNDDSVLYLQTSQCNMIEKNEFDTVYHEHISFFSERSMAKLLSINGLRIIKREKTNIHGDSFLFTIKKGYSEEGKYPSLDLRPYKDNVIRIGEELRSVFLSLKNRRFKMIGYGASAKGNTLLNYLKLPLDYIVDDQKSKWGLYTPGMNIPIHNPQRIENEVGNIVVLALAWNFLDEIVRKIRYLTKDRNLSIYILSYFPEVKLTLLRKEDNMTLISHFYNESYLLPHWLEHHKTIFDYGIMIDYGSDDDSVSIIKKIVPHWKIVSSKHTFFDAIDCDNEVKEYEREIKEGYKIALNITEFIDPYIRKNLGTSDIYSIRVIPMIEPKENYYKELDGGLPLLKQRFHGDLDSTARSQRFLHNLPCLDYDVGRHRLKSSPSPVKELSLDEGVILWFGLCPFNSKMIYRMIAKNIKYSSRDIGNGSAILHDLHSVLKEIDRVKSKDEIDDLRFGKISRMFEGKGFLL